MYVGPHSKHRKKIHKSILNLGWNGMCSTETVHLDKVFQRSACQSRSAAALRRTRGLLCDWGEVARAVNTLSVVVVFIALTKPLAFPDLPCQSCVYRLSKLEFFCTFSLSFGLNSVFFFLDLVGCQAGVAVWKKTCPKPKTIMQKSELMWGCLCIFFYRNGLKIESLAKISTKNVGLFHVLMSSTRISMIPWPWLACVLWWRKNLDPSLTRRTHKVRK